MSWAGEFKAIGYYKYTDSAGRVWRFDHRKLSSKEPEGWYLTGPTGTGVLGEFMGAKLSPAKHKVVAFVSAFDVHAEVERAESERLDEQWDQAMREA